MSMLHIVNKSPFEKDSLDACLRVAKSGSSILLTEDGVLAATQSTAVAGKLGEAMQNIKVYALGPDLKARGITDKRLLDGVSVVEYSDFVDLVASHDNNQSWV